MIDLAPHHLETVRRILAEHVPGCEVRAFGSRAKWEGQDYSDLDLAVVCGDEENGRAIKHLKQAFEESDLPIRVDVLDWHAIAEDFRQAIESECVVVQQARVLASWQTVRLGELVHNLDSRRVPLSRRVRSARPGPYPYHGATGVMDYIDDYLFEGLHLLVAEDGSVETSAGKPYLQLVDGKFWVNNHAHVLRGGNDDETRYLYYALSTVDIRPYISGSVQGKLSQWNLNQILLPYPHEEYYRRSIASVLGVLDNRIELYERMTKTLEDITQALFKSWFVDFDPVHAKAEGRPSGLPSHLDSLFPNSFQPSKLGPIPEGWTIKPLSSLARHSKEPIDPSDFPDMVFDHYSIPAYDSGRMPVKQYGNAIKSHKFIVRPGSILASRLNPEIERVWLPELVHSEEAICSTEFLVLMPRHPFTTEFLYCHARSNTFRHRLISLVTGTSRSHQRAPAKAAMSMDTLVPPSSLISAFDRSSCQLLESVLELRREVTSLVLMRDILLPRLVSGCDRMAHTNVSA